MRDAVSNRHLIRRLHQRGASRVQCGRGHETPRVRVSLEERLHFTPQIRIVAAHRFEERRALLDGHRERRMIELPDLSMALRRHRRLVPVSSR